MAYLATKICEQNVSINAYKIKDKSLKLLSFMERETRLELATSSLARRHSTTELPPHWVLLYYYMNNFFLQAFFIIFFYAASSSFSLLSIERILISIRSGNALFKRFISSFEVLTQNNDEVKTLTSPSKSFILKVTGSEPAC